LGPEERQRSVKGAVSLLLLAVGTRQVVGIEIAEADPPPLKDLIVRGGEHNVRR
jgi:hypothetical protein